MSASTAATKTRQPSAAAIRRKQAECSHPARNVHPTFDPAYEICDLCSIIRPAGSAAPWVIAHDLAQPEPPIPPLFEGYEPEPDPEEQPEEQQPRRCPIATAESDPKRARQRARIREAYHVAYRPLTREERREIAGHPAHCRHVADAKADAEAKADALNARLMRLGGNYERAQIARDFGRCVTIASDIAATGAELDRLTDCAYEWPFTVLRGRNVIRRARGLELLNL
jgi:hypothetical protein